MKPLLQIFFPRGCGGSWLSNMIWHLQNNDWNIPKVKIVFDLEPQSTVPVGHSFEIPDPSHPEKMTFTPASRDQSKVLSTKSRFNYYLLLTEKVWYGIHQIDQLPLIEQFFKLTDTARYILTNGTHHEYYEQVDLNYDLIFQDPAKFIDQLFDLLDEYNVKYTPNREYALESVKYYRSTCPDPELYLNNLNSLPWLAWVHAISLIEEINLSGIISETTSIEEMAEILKPANERAYQRALETIFYWKK